MDREYGEPLQLLVHTGVGEDSEGYAELVGIYADGQAVVLARYDAGTGLSVVSTAVHESLVENLAKHRHEVAVQETEEEDNTSCPSWDEILRKAQGQ